MKISCLSTISTVFVLIVVLLLSGSGQKQKGVSYCPDSPLSTLSVGMTVHIMNVAEGSFLPLYSEAYGTGGTNGGVTNGSELNIVDGPYCSQGTIWWKVTNGDLTGYAYQTKDNVTYLSPVN